jgi:hypothetical protein
LLIGVIILKEKEVQKWKATVTFANAKIVELKKHNSFRSSDSGRAKAGRPLVAAKYLR